MPQACTLIRTVPGPGSGTSRSTISKGPFGRATCATRIFAMFLTPSARRAGGEAASCHSRHPTPVTGRGTTAAAGSPPGAHAPARQGCEGALAGDGLFLGCTIIALIPGGGTHAAGSGEGDRRRL